MQMNGSQGTKSRLEAKRASDIYGRPFYNAVGRLFVLLMRSSGSKQVRYTVCLGMGEKQNKRNDECVNT